jgi:NTP pyrophosphatase (non-canonical NTP hydrolase)
MIRTFDDYQTIAVLTAIYPDDIRILYPALGLAGAAGEVANKVKKIYRDDGGQVTDDRRAQIAHELGGVLWYVAAVCTDLNLNMGDVARENVAILASRQERGTLHGDGDER